MPVTHYIWDEVNDTLLMEKDEAGNTIAEYTHEPGQYGPLISQRRNGQTRYHHFDGQGSTRALTDESGAVTDTYTYTAFGEPVASSGTTTNPFGYKGALGYYVNPDTADLYVRQGTYSPVICRFLSPVGRTARYLGPSVQREAVDQSGSAISAWSQTSSEQPSGTSVGPIPQVTWPPSLGKKCGAAGRAEDESETNLFCGKAELWGSAVCKVCRPRDIVNLVEGNSCCDLALLFHRGGEENTGGNVSYCCEKCRILPNPDLEMSLKAAFLKNKCKPCRIVLNACSFGLYYSPMRDLAKDTGCIVCGQIACGGGEMADLETAAFRCVDSGGNQVMGPGHIPFDPAHLGYPPSKPQSIPVCEDPPFWVPIL